jgi:hypothetical protein
MAAEDQKDLIPPIGMKITEICIIDASFSTISQNALFNGETVFKIIKDKIIKHTTQSTLRLIFWNSDNMNDFFSSGAYVCPAVVKRESINQCFEMVKKNITGKCCTEPHFGFNSIPKQWIDPLKTTIIKFFTDGQMGYALKANASRDDRLEFENYMMQLKQKLAKSIKNVVSDNVQIEIYTIEPVERDYGDVEVLKKAAGCDVYHTIMDNNLTDYITIFMAYSLNNLNGFFHIHKIKAPPGYFAYRNQIISELKVYDFINNLKVEIKSIIDSGKIQETIENELVDIIQKLSSILRILIKDKPLQVANGIISTFCMLFQNTPIDTFVVDEMLKNGIKREQQGQAAVIADFRASLKNLFKTADKFLNDNTKSSIGVTSKTDFCSVPINGKIITGNYKLLDKTLSFNGKSYPQCATDINGFLFPVCSPLTVCEKTLITEQCRRQFTRSLCATMYNMNNQDDCIIYIVMGWALQASFSSDIAASVHSAYRRLAVTMLEKRRARENITELDRLLKGELPTPNSGKMSDFFKYMEKVKEVIGLKINIKPMTMWYILCLGLGNGDLITKQYRHCVESLDSEKEINIKMHGGPGDFMLFFNVIKPHINLFTHYHIDNSNAYDYTECPVTIEDTTKTGGYILQDHNDCSPMIVISEEGMKQLTLRPDLSRCFMCYYPLTEKDFIKIGPKLAENSYERIVEGLLFEDNIFGDHGYARKSIQATLPVRVSLNDDKKDDPSNAHVQQSKIDVTTKVINPENTDKYIVILKGTVGAGKSTFAYELQKLLTAQGYYCVVEGTDKHVIASGLPVQRAMKSAMKAVTAGLRVAQQTEGKVCVILDTCGTTVNIKQLFGCNFSAWKQIMVYPNINPADLSGYYAWTLYNVLSRGKSTKNEIFCLEPTSAGLSKCIEIHNKKSCELFGIVPSCLRQSCPADVESAVLELLEQSKEYALGLKPVEEVVQEFVKNYF